MLIPLTFFPSKCLVIHGYAMTLFLSEVLPTFPTLDFSLLWMTAAVSSPAFLYVHVHTCTHIHTHKIRQPNRNQFMPFLCLKLWNGFPKYSKKKNPKFLPRSTRPCKTWPSPNSSSYYVPSRQISFLIHIHSTSISFLTSGSLHYLPPYESVSCSVVSGSLRPHWL